MRARRCLTLVLFASAVGLWPAPALHAQFAPAAAAPAAQFPAVQVPAARPEDVESIDAIIAALYAVISGDAGVKRDWDRFRSLFVPQARLIPTGRRADGTGGHRVLTPDEYATTQGPMLERGGFHEREIGRKLERYGNIAHLMSAYDSKRALTDSAPFARGINSIQLWNDGKRWWVVTIFWEGETPSNPIPADYLSAPARR